MAKTYHFKTSNARMHSKCGVKTEIYKTTYKNVTCRKCLDALIVMHLDIANKIETKLGRRE